MKFQKLKSSFEDVIFCWWREGLRLPTMTSPRPIKSEFCAFYYLFKKKKVGVLCIGYNLFYCLLPPKGVSLGNLGVTA